MNLENLRIAVEGIEKMNIRDDQFDISNYGGIGCFTKEEVKKNHCNTTACFLGWFPFVEGLKPVDSDYDEGRFCYDFYSIRVLDVGYSIGWQFLFSYYWRDYDNTLKGALRRAKYILDGNDIGEFEYEDFKEGWSYEK